MNDDHHTADETYATQAIRARQQDAVLYTPEMLVELADDDDDIDDDIDDE